ncbi:hypothetical protein Lesp02_56100 [Lentzea sp. NBRC 105346]|uniref:hypothetical protein n=1 Tax=Lentzea sp. NBRC 105346 TaxID=3032205 RepID=UPI0024A3AACA|nr:hypothetical protein [Lentzea sp. NBRC 105346]GLZ33422.1 hypothetical protein Lesp02_56100 [Lentzea sp. NBRC 105346]
MSLVSHLFHGELGDWCADRLTGSASVADDLFALIKDRSPIRPAGTVDRQHWDRASRTFAIRLATAVQAAPPYSSLLGLVRTGFVTRAWADEQAIRYPTHARLSAAQRGRALDLRPAIDGWVDLGAARERGSAVMPAGSLEQAERWKMRPGLPDQPVLAELFDRMRAYFWAHAPHGQLGEIGPETGLARLCWLLAAFEYVYRNDSSRHPLFQLFRDEPPTVRQLHAAADDEAIADPVALVRHVRECGAFDELRRLAGDPPVGTPLGIAAPAIFDHWDDATFVLGGPDGTTLAEVTAAVAVDKGDRSTRRIWKLLASAWLDTDDAYRIRNVAIYFARYGALVTWPVEELEQRLLENGHAGDARRAFVELAKRLRADDYARRLAYRETVEA